MNAWVFAAIALWLPAAFPAAAQPSLVDALDNPTSLTWTTSAEARSATMGDSQSSWL